MPKNTFQTHLSQLTEIIAALMSQFSAAVADTGGAGGLLNENSGNRLPTKISYVAISMGAN
jgi:hypothetical protein